MSVNVESRVVRPGGDDFIEEAWELKERIREDDGVLKQRQSFFTDAYRRSTVYCFVNEGLIEELIGFAATRRDGYILFLAIALNSVARTSQSDSSPSSRTITRA